MQCPHRGHLRQKCRKCPRSQLRNNGSQSWDRGHLRKVRFLESARAPPIGRPAWEPGAHFKRRPRFRRSDFAGTFFEQMGRSRDRGHIPAFWRKKVPTSKKCPRFHPVPTAKKRERAPKVPTVPLLDPTWALFAPMRGPRARLKKCGSAEKRCHRRKCARTVGTSG